MRVSRQLLSIDKFYRSWECKHEFIEQEEDLVCHRCKFIKYKIEIDSELFYVKRLKKNSELLMVKNKHIDLFHF